MVGGRERPGSSQKPIFMVGTYQLSPRNTRLESLSTYASDDRYTVRLANGPKEIESAFRLRHQVFNVELRGLEVSEADQGLEFDTYDLKCRHLVVVANDTGETVGTYRLNSLETAHSTCGFYSANEFTIEDLPHELIERGIEIGRACIAREHRNTKVLFLLWKGLLNILEGTRKRYFFGCCSVFTQDARVGRKIFAKLSRDGHIHDHLKVRPCRNPLSLVGDLGDAGDIELPALFNMYLRLGARVCGPPMVDREFGTLDFFVVFDLMEMSQKYKGMFYARARVRRGIR